MSETPPVDAPQDDNGQPHLSLMTEYLKDLSFENPGAPITLMQDNSNLKQELNIEINVSRPVKDQSEHYEVELLMSMKAMNGETIAYVAELNYAGFYRVQNIPEEHLGAALGIECPRMLFPFARRVMSDAIRDGGFRPPMLEPIDFAGIYQARMAQAQQMAAQQQAGATGQVSTTPKTDEASSETDLA